MKKLNGGSVLKIATHPGGFHADDVFAVAALQMWFYTTGKEEGCHTLSIEVIRTRDEKRLSEVDFRVDVGGKYNPETGDFDHHLPLEPREKSGMPYAAFGLVWKECGVEICDGDKEASEIIEEELATFIDCDDNGANSFAHLNGCTKVSAFTISDMIKMYNPLWDENGSGDAEFQRSVEVAIKVLRHLIARAKSIVRAKDLVRFAVNISPGERFIIIDTPELPWEDLIHDYIDDNVLYVIYARKTGRWQIKCIEDMINGRVVRRKSLPESWWGKEDRSFVSETGLVEAKFCHKNGHTCVALTKEAAIELVEIAIKA